MKSGKASSAFAGRATLVVYSRSFFHCCSRSRPMPCSSRALTPITDGRLGAGADLVEAAGALGAERIQLRLRVLLVVLALLVDVAARGERLLPGAGDDDAADVVVGDRARDRLVQFRRELAVERVELVRPVQGEDRDAVRLLGEQVVCHPASLASAV